MALAATAVAVGGGGRSIAAAPTLTLGQEQVNSIAGIDFWRVPLREGDRLTIRFGPQGSPGSAEVCLHVPAVADDTVGNQRCYATRNAFSTEESLTLDARPAGLWTVAVLRPLANCESGGILNVRCSSDVSYHLTAYVKHRTRVTVDAPNIARRNARFVVRGRLEGVRGSVLLEGSWNGSKWSTLGVVRTSSSGAYQMPLRLENRGTFRLRATYPEAPHYVGSSALTSIRVV